MRKIFFFFLLLLFSFSHLYSQESEPIPDEVDSLFNDEETVEEEVPSEEAEKDENNDLLQTVMTGEPFTISADFLMIGGYSPGLDYLPGDPFEVQYADQFIFKFNSSVSLNFQFSPVMRIFNKIAIRFPDFLLEVNELFCDYNLADIIFMKLGRQNIAWGISRNYQFTNLLARLPESTENDVDADSFSVKMNIPIGTGGFETVAFTRNTFWDTPKDPAMDEIGYGGKLNLAFDILDFDFGGFYHKDLYVRFFYSLKTTLFDFLEVYTEGLLAIEQDWFADPDNSFMGFSANAGVYVDFFDRAVQVNAEYFYNGELTEQEVKGDLFPMVPGHNVALNLAFASFKRKFKVLFQGKYNISENTGMLIPAVTFSAFPNQTFSLAIPYIIGPTTGTYFVENEENDNRRICLVLAIVLKGSI